jgi:AcrR family transcriptional regulator
MTADASSKLTPRAREIVAAARELLESEGPDGLSMRNLAARLGIRAPSLYKHLPDKQALENALISDGFNELAQDFEAALESPDQLRALAAAYRAFGRAHPHLYRLMTERPLQRDRIDAGVEERAAACVMVAMHGDPDGARAAWSFAHGMTILELDGRFPAGADLDAAWEFGLRAFARG